MKKYIKASEIPNVPIEELWGWVCSNDIDNVVNYYNRGGEVGRKYNRFGYDNSLIMGAVRNGNYELANILADYGEDVSHSEAVELNSLLDGRYNSQLEDLVSKLIYSK